MTTGFPNPRLLLHPNIPKPLHGLNPRSIMGQSWWDAKRHEAYAKYGHRCWACGVHKREAEGDVYWLEAHEHYNIDYTTGRVELKEIVALCHYCHNYIHDGRLRMMVEKGEVTQKVYDAVMRYGDKVLASAGLKREVVIPKKIAPWEEWHLVVEGVPYYSMFAGMEEWMDHYMGDG